MELYSECKNGNFEKIKLLFENLYINLFFCDNYGRNYFHMACIYGSLEIIKYLLIKTEYIVNLELLNRFKITKNHADFLNIKIFINAKIIDIINKTDCDEITPFILACENNHINIIDYLLNDSRIDINKRDKYGYTALYYACLNQNYDTINILLKNERIDINRENKNGCTPFHIICYRGNLNCIKLFLEDPRTITNKINNSFKTPFHYACLNNNIQCINFLLNHPRIDNDEITNYYFNQYPEKIEMTKKMVFLYAISDGKLNKKKKINDIIIYFGKNKKYWTVFTKEQYDRIIWVKN